MIDIENLEKRVTKEVQDNEGILLGKPALVEIIIRLRQAEKDAARYRWLRENSTTGQSFGGFMIDVDCDGRPSNPFSGIDALIDKAMKCNGDNK